MDLFVVNRYEGEKKPDASDEKTKLDKVLKKIKKRKLARERRRHEENLKVKKVSKFKVDKAKRKKIKAKFKKGKLLSTYETNKVLEKRIIPVKDLAANINKGQLKLTKKTRKLAYKLIEKEAIQEEKQTRDEAKKRKKTAKKLVDSATKKSKRKRKRKNEKETNKDAEPNKEDVESNEDAEESNEDAEESNEDAEESNEDVEELNEEIIGKLSAEEIAEKLLQKQIENFNKSNEDKKDEKKKLDKEIDETKTSKKSKKKKKTEETTIEEQDSDVDESIPKKPKKLTTDDVEGFTILGVDKFAKKKTVKRVLPKWLRNPTVISSDLTNLDKKITATKLNIKLKQKLKEKQIKYLFPVQAEFIPWQLKVSKISGLISPPDACISAPTGSGKTLAFTVPVLQSLLQQMENRCLTIKAIRALIILPTQNLALQIFDTFKTLISGSELNVGLATGAGNRPLQAEQKQLITYNSIWGASSKVDILICTAGRLVDHLKSTKGFDLTHLQYLIIDEADRVLDTIQDDWLYHLGIHLRQDALNRNIVNVTSVKQRTDPQKLLFSATLSQDPEKLQKLSLFQPKLFTCISENVANLENTETTENAERFIGKYTTPAELIEKYIICTIEIKPLVLYKLIIGEIDKNQNSRILVFVNTMETLHRLNVLLKYMGQEKFTVAEFSSNQGNLSARQVLLKKFEMGLVQVLVCTDAMARGIDIPNVDCVISYSVPNHLKTYIHRAGRTARAGSTGLCISMMHAKQQKSFLGMIENMRTQTKTIDEIRIPSEDLEILTPLYEQCLVQLKEKVSDEIEQTALRIKTKKLAFNNRKKNRKLRKIAKKTT